MESAGWGKSQAPSENDGDRVMDSWLNRYRVRSTIILSIAMWMLIDAARWGMWFAVDNSRAGLEIAAILTAIQAPATFFAGWAFKIFQENKTL